MKKQIIIALLLAPCTIVGMQEGGPISQLAALVKNGANIFEVKSFLGQPGVEFEIIRGDDNAGVASLSQALKDSYFDQRDPELYKRFTDLFLIRYYSELQNENCERQEAELMYENDKRQEAKKATTESEANQAKEVLVKLQ